MTRAEHLAWCKERALMYLDLVPPRPDEAFASFLSDMRKHPQLENHVGLTLGAGLLFVDNWVRTVSEVRKWIEGFN